MIVRAVIFTYVPDLQKACLAARTMRSLGIEVFLAVDDGGPWIHAADARTIRTKFERLGNLNGLPCTLGILETMRSISEGADWVLKVDSDTLVMGLEWLDQQADVIGVGMMPTNELFGMCYGIRPSTLPAFIESVRARGEVGQRHNGGRPGEDQLIGSMAHQLGILHNYQLYSPGCPLWTWQYGNVRTPEAVVKTFEVLSVQPDDPRAPDAREKVLSIMQSITDARELHLSQS